MEWKDFSQIRSEWTDTKILFLNAKNDLRPPIGWRYSSKLSRIPKLLLFKTWWQLAFTVTISSSARWWIERRWSYFLDILSPEASVYPWAHSLLRTKAGDGNCVCQSRKVYWMLLAAPCPCPQWLGCYGHAARWCHCCHQYGPHWSLTFSWRANLLAALCWGPRRTVCTSQSSGPPPSSCYCCTPSHRSSH